MDTVSPTAVRGTLSAWGRRLRHLDEATDSDCNSPRQSAKAGLAPSKWVDHKPVGTVRRPPINLLTCLTLMAAGSPALAQVETFMLKPGSNVGPATKVTPTNCVTAPDGSVTCDTRIENSPSDTPAKPGYSPFKN